MAHCKKTLKKRFIYCETQCLKKIKKSPLKFTKKLQGASLLTSNINKKIASLLH